MPGRLETFGLSLFSCRRKGRKSFYDEDQAGENKFSLAAYLKRFRTHTDNGEPLSTESITDAYVSTPTHVIIQLGLNDLYNQEYKDQIASLVSRIKEEFPDMIVGLSLTDAFGTAFSKYYPDYDPYLYIYFKNNWWVL